MTELAREPFLLTRSLLSFLTTDWNQCKESNSWYWSSSLRMYATPVREEGGKARKKVGWSTRFSPSGCQPPFQALCYLSLPLPTLPVSALTHCKSVISENSSLLVLLAHLLFGTHNVFHIVQSLQVQEDAKGRRVQSPHALLTLVHVRGCSQALPQRKASTIHHCL